MLGGYTYYCFTRCGCAYFGCMQVQEALSSRPLEAVRVLLKEGWLPDRIFNKAYYTY